MSAEKNVMRSLPLTDRRPRFSALILLVLASIACGCTSALAAPDPNYTAGVASYNAGKYSVALAKFETAITAHPRDALLHYYIALCSQNMHQMAKAKMEYEWVRDNAPQQKLRSMAQTGLQSIGGYKGHIAASAGTSPASSSGGSSASSNSTASSSPSSSTAGKGDSGKGKGSKIAKIIEFTMANQRQCLIFDETFQATRGSYPKIKFEQMYDSDPSASSLMEKYSVSQFPTVVFVDSKGNSLASEYAAGMTDLGSMIDRINGGKSN